MKSCFFIGHRDISNAIHPILQEAVERHIVQYGVQEFIVGNYGGFDAMVQIVLREAKLTHPEIILRMLIPYHPSLQRADAPAWFDNTYYPEGMENVPKPFAIVRANRYMVAHVDYLIAYVWHTASKSKEILEYAQRLEKKESFTLKTLRIADCHVKH